MVYVVVYNTVVSAGVMVTNLRLPGEAIYFKQQVP